MAKTPQVVRVGRISATSSSLWGLSSPQVARFATISATLSSLWGFGPYGSAAIVRARSTHACRTGTGRTGFGRSRGCRFVSHDRITYKKLSCDTSEAWICVARYVYVQKPIARYKSGAQVCRAIGLRTKSYRATRDVMRGRAGSPHSITLPFSPPVAGRAAAGPGRRRPGCGRSRRCQRSRNPPREKAASRAPA